MTTTGTPHLTLRRHGPEEAKEIAEELIAVYADVYNVEPYRSDPFLRKPHVELTIDGETDHVSTALVQFREVYTYFGKLRLQFGSGPPAPMTVLTFDRIRRGRVPQIGFDAMLHRDLSAVKGARIREGVERLDLVANPPVAAQADGESLGMVDSGVIEWTPAALKVVADLP